ncbi:hypothetical protein FQZ97_951120 [compost metagenome]
MAAVDALHLADRFGIAEAVVLDHAGDQVGANPLCGILKQDRVVAFATYIGVRTRSADQEVIACATIDAVVAGEPVDGVVLGASDEGVIVFGTGNRRHFGLSLNFSVELLQEIVDFLNRLLHFGTDPGGCMSSVWMKSTANQID